MYMLISVLKVSHVIKFITYFLENSYSDDILLLLLLFIKKSVLRDWERVCVLYQYKGPHPTKSAHTNKEKKQKTVKINRVSSASIDPAFKTHPTPSNMLSPTLVHRDAGRYGSAEGKLCGMVQFCSEEVHQGTICNLHCQKRHRHYITKWMY